MVLNDRKTVTVRHIGDSNFFAIPKSIHVKLNSKYRAFYGRYGSITYLPIKKNIFDNPKYKDVNLSQHGIKMGGLKGHETPDS